MRPPPAPARRPLRALGALFVLALLAAPAAHAQSAALSGIVRDSTTGETLIGANVVLAGTTRGSATNTGGFYSLAGLDAGAYTLTVSFLGYVTASVPVTLAPGEERQVDVQLVPAAVTGEEVVVEAEASIQEQAQVGLQTLPIRLVPQLPSVFESDLLRTLQLLPGVKSSSDFSSKLYVRGGSPDQTLIPLDGTTVYNPTHFFGFFSTFNTEAIKDVRFYKGAYPVLYGGRLGAVVDIYNREGNRNRTEGTVQVGLLASRAGIEGPLNLGGRTGSYMLAVRRSTLEPLLAALRESLDDSAIPDRFYFYDVNASVGVELSPRDRLSIAGYAGRDAVTIPFSDQATADLDYGNATLSLGYTRLLTPSLFSQARATGSYYFSYPVGDIGGTTFERPNTITDLSGRVDLEWTPTSRFEGRAGVWGGYFDTRLRQVFAGVERLRFRAPVPYASGYTQGVWSVGDGWRVTAGLRGEFFGAGMYFRLSPQLQFERAFGDNVLLQLAGGRYNQFLSLISNEAFSGFDVWVTAADGVEPAYGDQLVLGLKTRLGAGVRLETEVYGRTMRNLFEVRPELQDPSGLDYADIFRIGEGYAAGWEVLLQRDVGRVNGLLGYTLGMTRRRYPADPSFSTYFPPKYDRLHDVTAVVGYELGRGWTANATAVYATGQAYTLPNARYRLAPLEFISGDVDVFISRALNNERLPAYHRLDLGLTKVGRVFGVAYELQLQGINVYNRRNLWFIQPDFTVNPIEQVPVRQLPFLPNVSFQLRF